MKYILVITMLATAPDSDAARYSEANLLMPTRKQCVQFARKAARAETDYILLGLECLPIGSGKRIVIRPR